MLDGSEWSVANLRKLCGDLGIKNTGSRSSLVRRLQRYHKENATQKFGAGAFAGIGVQLYSRPQRRRGQGEQTIHFSDPQGTDPDFEEAILPHAEVCQEDCL